MGFENRDYYGNNSSWQDGLRSWPLPPRGTLIVAGVCVVVFILQGLTGDLRRGVGPMTAWLGLTVGEPVNWLQVWRWVTYQYLHSDAFHIFFNLLMVFFFMPSLERRWGTARTLIFYTLGGIAAGLVFAVFSVVLGSTVPIIGASGSALAVLGACALLFPEKTVIFLVFPLPIRVLAMLLALLYFLTAVGGGNLSDACHLGGLAFGVFGPMVGTGFVENYFARRAAARRRAEADNEIRMQQAVDGILEKVHQQGMNSLSNREKAILKYATEKQQEREKKSHRR
jgi:membrane associated rhomboid family serine protease